jgi:hypothetical protein
VAIYWAGEIASSGDQVDDDCLGGARAGAEPPSVLAADKDLFGRWQAVVTFRRIGRRGQARRHAFEDEAGLSRFVRRGLLRRRTATRRIGAGYEAVEASPSVLPLLMQLGVGSGYCFMPHSA